MAQGLLAGPLDFSRLGDISGLPEMPLAKIPTYYYDLTNVSLPMTDVEFEDFFEKNREVFVVKQPVEDNRQTNTATGTSVNEAFVACGLGIELIGEGEAFVVRGASLATQDDTAAGSSNTPNISAVEQGCYCGTANISTEDFGLFQHATLWWGAPTWRFIEQFFRSFRVQLSINRRFLLVDEGLNEIGLVPATPEFEGASSSEIPSVPFIRRVNDVMREKGVLQVFAAPSTISPGETDQVVPPLTVPVTYGHPKIHGIANRLYCLAKPLLFVPGMQFSMRFVRDISDSAFGPMRNVVQANCITQSDIFTGTISVDGVPVANAGATCTIPGGTISMGMVLKGFALQPEACVSYLKGYVLEGTTEHLMYTQVLGTPSGGEFLRGLPK